MKFVPLLLANFKRHRLRTVLTVLSIVVAFVLFGYLGAIRKAFEFGASISGDDRLVVRHKISLVRLLPDDYEAEIETIDGVARATHTTFFVGVYRDPKNFFGQMAVEPEEFLQAFPEFVLPADQQAAWMRTRTGAIVGRRTADRFGWRIGDKIPIRSPVWPPKSGDGTWVFDLVGIYEGARKETDTSNFFFRYDFFDENRERGRGMVGWYHVRVNDPRQAAAVAARIDERFANSSAETKTESQAALLRGAAAQIGNIGAIVQAILAVVFFTILLVAGNTMAQSVRERFGELGVMKAIGFTDPQLLALVLIESCLVALTGGVVGLILGWGAVAAADPTRGLLPGFVFKPADLTTGLALALTLGITAGLLPALQAMRLNTVEALKTE